MFKKYLLALTATVLSTSAFAESMIVKQDFATLFNQFRYAEPAKVPWAGSYFAYANNGLAMGIVNGHGDKGQSKLSPSYLYDQLYNNGKPLSTDYENKYHSCDSLKGEEKAGCEAWWGHCNGWAGAATKEAEPQKSVNVRGKTFEVGHQKALLTELYMTGDQSYLGETQKVRKTGTWIYDVNDPDYQTFWDVSPRQLFLGFVNQVGIQRTGVVVDRFTGDQVWNQPIVGYRILPIRSSDLGHQTYQGKNFYYANMRMKIYWANDNVHPGHLSSGFNIKNTTDSESYDSLGADYDQRTLYFKLFFDAPVVLSSSGTQVQSAGNLVGDGLWAAQETPSTYPQEVDQSHPDFIWQVDSVYIDESGEYGNPYMGLKEIHEITSAAVTPPVVQPPTPQPPPRPTPQPTPQPTPPPTPVPPTPMPYNGAYGFEIETQRTNIYDGDNALIAERLIARIFRRANLNIAIDQKDITLSPGKILFKVNSGSPVTVNVLKQAFEDAEAKVIRITPL